MWGVYIYIYNNQHKWWVYSQFLWGGSIADITVWDLAVTVVWINCMLFELFGKGFEWLGVVLEVFNIFGQRIPG